MGRRGTQVTMPYVQAIKTRHGKTLYYFRRDGKRTPLPGSLGEAAFMAAYAAATKAEKPAPAPRGDPGTFNRLIADYEQSTQFKRLKASTARVYRNIFARFGEKHGTRLVSQMKRQHVDSLVADMAGTPGAANSFLKRLKTLMVFAVSRGLIGTDPTYRQKGFETGEFHTWTEAQIDTFEAHWAIGTTQRLAFALHLFTGQRRSDVHRMTWADFDGARIKVVQQKTGVRLSVPVHADLAAILKATERKHLIIIATSFGKAFSVAGYGTWINAAIRKAGLPVECKGHGLRKAAARRLADAGCTPHEIGSITGHRTLAEVERYTRAADQVKLSDAAMAKQSANRIGKPVSE